MANSPYVSHDTCHELLVTCQVSHVTCQVSHVPCNSQTIRAREHKFWEKFHLIPLVTCHKSCLPCPMSHVMSHMFLSSFFGQNGEASHWSVCYQRGLPSLGLVMTRRVIPGYRGSKNINNSIGTSPGSFKRPGVSG